VALVAALWLLLCQACLPAVRRVDDQLLGDISCQLEPGWELRRNYRWLGSRHVLLVTDPPSATLSLELLRLNRRHAELPLDLLAEGALGNIGRRVGIETHAGSSHEVLLAGRRAIALTGRRRHGPVAVDFTAWIARTDRQLLIMVLHVPPGQLPRHARLLERLLYTLELPRAPTPPDTLDGA